MGRDAEEPRGGNAWKARERARWRAFPRVRPGRVPVPGPGQESVWDYPRPPRLERVGAPVRVVHAGREVARTLGALRVVETASPPVYYLPPGDVRREWLARGERTSFCEWKGTAVYHALRVPGAPAVPDAAWSYAEPDAGFEAMRDHLAFFAGRVDACFVGDERVRPQEGAYYGGWITSNLLGPFKGSPGTESW